DAKLPSLTMDQAKAIEAVVTGLQQTLQRYEKISDPTLKFSLVLDKFLFMTDMLSGLVQAQVKECPPHLHDAVLKLTISVRTMLMELSEWVMHPVYSPDHPFGQNVMQTAARDLQDKTPLVEQKRNGAT